MTALDASSVFETSRPPLYCSAGCGYRLDNIGAPGYKGAVLIHIGEEPYWFCGVLCARNCLEQMCEVIYDGGNPNLLDFMLWHTLSPN